MNIGIISSALEAYSKWRSIKWIIIIIIIIIIIVNYLIDSFFLRTEAKCSLSA